MVVWSRDAIRWRGKQAGSDMKQTLKIYPIEFSDRLDVDCEINRKIRDNKIKFWHEQ